MRVLFLIPPSKFAKNVARDLIYGCWCKGKRIAGLSFPPLSLLSIATVLKKDGFDVSLQDASTRGNDIKEVISMSKKYDCAVMLTSTVSINEDAGIFFQMKQVNPKLKSIVYGGHVTSQPESSLDKPGIDIVVRGDGEFIIRDLVRSLSKNEDWMKVKGISFKENGSYVHTESYPALDVNELPIPERDMLPKDIVYFNPVVKRTPYTTVFTSRGCPGKCVFCTSPTFYGKKIRFRSAQLVIDELEQVVKEGYKEVFFRDEIFTADRRRLLDICESIIVRNLDLTWICSSRVDSIDLEMLEIMKEAGCHMVRFGVESGAQELLDNIKKGISVEQIRRVFKWTHQIGIDTHAHLMLGLPGETRESINKTLRFVKEIDPTIVTFGILTVYPGTPLFNDLLNTHPELKEKIQDGTSADLKKLHTKSFFNEYFTVLSEEDLSKYVRKAYMGFYLRPSYLIRWFGRIKSFSELVRVLSAGRQVMSFVFEGE